MKNNSCRGTSLVEVMIAMTLSVFVLGAVLDTNLFITKTSLRIASYNDMEREATLGLEKLGRELRMTQQIVSSGTPINQVSLTVPDSTGTGSHPVVYTYDSAQRTFSRMAGGTTTPLIRNIQSGSFSFKRFDKMQNSLDGEGVALPDYSTKQLQITLMIAPDTKGLVAATTKRVISSRFVLRNL